MSMKPQEGPWTLTAPDGRTWTGETPLRCCGAEHRERVPPAEALKILVEGLAVSVIDEVNDERRRQIEPENWTPEHDDEHNNGELARAASCYAEHAARSQSSDWRQRLAAESKSIPLQWPWSKEWWKPKNPRRDLIRAAALIVAEIERLDRKAPNAEGQVSSGSAASGTSPEAPGYVATRQEGK